MEYMDKLLTLGLTNAATATALALIVACLSLVLARRPAWVHCLWLLVLVKLVTPPLFEIAIPGRDPEPRVAEAATTPVEEFQVVSVETLSALTLEEAGALELEVPSHDVSTGASAAEWMRGLALVWLSGTLAVLVMATVRIVRFSMVLRRTHPAPEEVREHVRELAERMGVARAPAVHWIDAPLAPMLWAVGCRARLLIPHDLWKSLSARQRTLMLVHELAHLRRGDHFLRVFELAVTALYWWLPVVWWARRALRDAEEQCCDAWVVWAFPDEARTYAETLLDTVDFLNPPRNPEPLLACGFGRAHHLRRRLTMIMLGTTPRRLGRRSALLAFAVAAALLPLTPSWAQKPKEEEKEVKVQAYAFEVADDSAAKQAGEVKSEVHVVVATDDDKREIKADSLDKAVELIKRKIEALAKDGDKSANHTAKLKGLKQALVELEKARDKVVILKVGKPHPHIFELQAVLEAESEAKLSAEAREKLDKAKARVESLRKELRQAEEELLKLSGHAANAQQGEGGVVVLREARGPREERVVVVGKPVKDKDVWTKSTQALTLLGGESAAKSSDHARLESLEKKLEKLLDEVAKLKKDEKKDK